MYILWDWNLISNDKSIWSELITMLCTCAIKEYSYHKEKKLINKTYNRTRNHNINSNLVTITILHMYYRDKYINM